MVNYIKQIQKNARDTAAADKARADAARDGMEAERKARAADALGKEHSRAAYYGAGGTRPGFDVVSIDGVPVRLGDKFLEK